jgi:hypothetical protein
MFALAQFYVIFKDDMKEHNPGKKFIAIKFVVFLSFWQNIALNLMQDGGILKPIPHWSLHDVHDGLQNLLIIIEMFIAAIFHIYAFPYREYSERNIRLSVWHSIIDVVNPSDVMRYTKSSFIIRKRAISMNNVTQPDNLTDSIVVPSDEEACGLLADEETAEDEEERSEELTRDNDGASTKKTWVNLARFREKLRATV